MKFRKKDIDKLIKILQDKKKELKDYKDDTLFEINSKGTFLHLWKEPSKYAVKSNNVKEGIILGSYVNSTWNQNQWLDTDINTGFYLHVYNGKYQYGLYDIEETFTEITFEEFETYIVNKK